MDFHPGNLESNREKKKPRIRALNKPLYSSIYKKTEPAHRNYVDINPVVIEGVKDKKKRIRMFQKNANPSEIVILLPNNYSEQTLQAAHNFLKYNKKTLLEWFVELKEREHDMTITIYGADFVHRINYIFGLNQKFRWNMKKLCLAWLKKQSRKKKIGENEDVITYEPLTDKDRIEIYCLKSRCIYYFSAQTLLKSICANLETQTNNIPLVTFPKNPLTNLTFDFGQLLHIYDECVAWGSRRKKPIPTMFHLFRNENFQINQTCRAHNMFIQHRASYNYMMNDDLNLENFYEGLGDLLKEYRDFLVLKGIHPKYIRLHNFKFWLLKDPNNALLKQWKLFVIDYLFYKDTDVFIRENWHSSVYLLIDYVKLFKVSIPYLDPLKGA